MAITAAEGAFSGLVATIPMTIAMEVLRRRLPRRQRQALPPRKITTRAIRKIGIHRHTDRRQRDVAALIGHLGYGATAGSVYPVLARRIEAAPVIAGLGFGLAVWLVSYMGWLPVARLYGPPTRDTGKRSALMIAAHLVWGGALGMLFDSRSKPPRSALCACEFLRSVGIARAAAEWSGAHSRTSDKQSVQPDRASAPA